MRRPEIASHQRRLRRLRARDALRILDDTTAQSKSRDLLLRELVLAARINEIAFGQADEATIDIVVSLALVTVPERDEDALGVVLLCAQVLARDGQFARLRQLAPKLRELADRFQVERPFLAAELRALVHAIEGQYDAAIAELSSVLGFSDFFQPTTRERSWEQIADILAAAALRSWLVNNDTELMAKGRDIALERADGLLLSNLDLLLTYATASRESDVRRLLIEADPIFSERRLSRYINLRQVRTFFPAQLEAIKNGVLENETRIVALPTSSGKTFLAELRIVATLTRSPGTRVIYIAPYRLLARQVETSLRHGLRVLGIEVRDLGGSFDISTPLVETDEESRLAEEQLDEDEKDQLPDVAVMTPERFDALMRLSTTAFRGSDQARELLGNLSLVIFDEIQLVGRPGRGPRFELLLARFRERYADVPILGLSAATHGADALGNWLGDNQPITGGQRPTGTLEFLWKTDGTLIQRYGDTAWKVAELERGRTAIEDAASLVLRFRAEYMPILVIENTRPNAERVARRIQQLAPQEGARWRDNLTEQQRTSVDLVAEEARVVLGENHSLAGLIRDGLAYHHAGVPSHLLRQIEGLASNKLLRALSATTTVAEGADLPFRAVVIPHLAFQGATGRLERDLYLNIIGRAGRANVAVEGLVFLLGSDARSLKSHVRSSLWSSSQPSRVRGLLSSVTPQATTFEEYAAFRDLQSQLLAWLGEESEPPEDQSQYIAERTLSWQTGAKGARNRITWLLDIAFEDLEDKGLIRAASPYALTGLGLRARLAGLSATSCIRIDNILRQGQAAWLRQLADATSLSAVAAETLARLLFECEELLEQGLWLRRAPGNESARVALFRDVVNGEVDWPRSEELYQNDVLLLANWMLGESYIELGRLAPSFRRGLFSSDDPSERASDAAELLGRFSYPSAWCWSGLRALAGAEGESLPIWISSALELGVSTQAGVELIATVGLSRDGATKLNRVLSTAWYEALEELGELTESDCREFGLSTVDTSRVRDFQRP